MATDAATNMFLKLLLSLLLIGAALSDVDDVSNVRLVLVGMRSGTRNPAQFLPDDPNGAAWGREGPDMLNNIGKQEAYGLGKSLRQRYRQLLPTQYSTKDTVTYSSSEASAQQSLQAAMAGLYPPTGWSVWHPELRWQPLHTRLNDPLLRISHLQCPRGEKVWGALRTDAEASLAALHAGSSDLVALLRRSTGWNGSLVELADVADNLRSIQLLNLTLPHWLRGQRLQERLSEFSGVRERACAQWPQCRRLAASAWLHHAGTALAKKFRDLTPHRKMLLYSSNLESTLSLVRLLGASVEDLPAAGGFALELRQDPGSRQALVRLLLHRPSHSGAHKTDFVLPLGGTCSLNGESLEWCPIGAFLAMISPFMASDWTSVCYGPSHAVPLTRHTAGRGDQLREAEGRRASLARAPLDVNEPFPIGPRDEEDTVPISRSAAFEGFQQSEEEEDEGLDDTEPLAFPSLPTLPIQEPEPKPSVPKSSPQFTELTPEEERESLYLWQEPGGGARRGKEEAAESPSDVSTPIPRIDELATPPTPKPWKEPNPLKLAQEEETEELSAEDGALDAGAAEEEEEGQSLVAEVDFSDPVAQVGLATPQFRKESESQSFSVSTASDKDQEAEPAADEKPEPEPKAEPKPEPEAKEELASSKEDEKKKATPEDSASPLTDTGQQKHSSSSASSEDDGDSAVVSTGQEGAGTCDDPRKEYVVCGSTCGRSCNETAGCVNLCVPGCYCRPPFVHQLALNAASGCIFRALCESANASQASSLRSSASLKRRIVAGIREVFAGKGSSHADRRSRFSSLNHTIDQIFGPEKIRDVMEAVPDDAPTAPPSRFTFSAGNRRPQPRKPQPEPEPEPKPKPEPTPEPELKKALVQKPRTSTSKPFLVGQCDDPLREFQLCGSACPPGCTQLIRRCRTSCRSGCFCRPGYVLADVGDPNSPCVRPDLCVSHTSPKPSHCGRNQRRADCAPPLHCQASCEHRSPAAQGRFCRPDCSSPSCVCLPGLLRGYNGTCVHPLDCDATVELLGPPTTPRPTQAPRRRDRQERPWTFVSPPAAAEAPAPPLTVGCEDSKPLSCRVWAFQGECHANPFWMKVNCQKSCSCCGCTPEGLLGLETSGKCADHNENCRHWASRGQCKSNQRFMKAYCPASCQSCQKASPRRRRF